MPRTRTPEERLANALEEHFKQMPRAKRVAKIRALAAANEHHVQAVFPDLYREAFPPPSPVAGGRTESNLPVGLSAKPR
jgi:hypothetical protein